MIHYTHFKEPRVFVTGTPGALQFRVQARLNLDTTKLLEWTFRRSMRISAWGLSFYTRTHLMWNAPLEWLTARTSPMCRGKFEPPRQLALAELSKVLGQDRTFKVRLQLNLIDHVISQ